MEAQGGGAKKKGERRTRERDESGKDAEREREREGRKSVRRKGERETRMMKIGESEESGKKRLNKNVKR